MQSYFDSLQERVIAGPDALQPVDYVLFCIVVVLALELLNALVLSSGRWFHANRIPVRGKHLDQFTLKDYAFVGFNKLATGPFVVFFFRYAYYEPNILWHSNKLHVSTVLLPLPFLFIVYDFFYTILHWALHVKSIYGYIHKHHHVQKAPSRANVDAVNVHPIEFFLGEYNHLLALYLCCQVLHLPPIHIAACILFLALGGALAGLNHTRYDVVLSFLGIKVFESKVHDVHHRFPQSNFGQYIMFWDVLFGTYRPYDEEDRVNPKSQLDPTTGKSIAYMEEKQRRAGKEH